MMADFSDLYNTVPVHFHSTHTKETLKLMQIERSTVTTTPFTVGEVIATTLEIYGVIFVFLFLVYICVRPIYQAAYNARGFHETFGRFSWIINIYTYDDDFLIEHCGLDSVSFLRLLRYGFKISLVGMINALVLIPVNATACRKNANDSCSMVKDYILQSGLLHAPSGSKSLYATTVAAYIFFGSAMYFIYTEFRWYTEKRHAFLKKCEPENYTVYISNIPPAYRSSQQLYEYICTIFSSDQVLDTHITLDIPQLEKLSMERQKLVDKLEHAINVKSVTGVIPKHRSPPLIGRKVDSIETFTSHLAEMNEDIGRRIDTIQAKVNVTRNIDIINDDNVGDIPNEQGAIRHSKGPVLRIRPEYAFLKEEISKSIEKGQALVRNSITTIKHEASAISDMIFNSSDGSERSAGFVTFKTLLAAAKCRQLLHHHTPFVFTVWDAPKPDDIFWKNVGLTNKRIQLGKLFSLALTFILCIIWTIPVSFSSSLSQASELKSRLPFLASWIIHAKWLVPLLAQLQPLLLVLLNSVVLKGILKLFCRLEGNISSTELNASLFSKLSALLIIQTFFIQAISGSVFSEINVVIKSPARIVDLLASSIPNQITSLSQYVIVQTFLTMGLELIRFVPITLAFIRRYLGPNLTPKERSTVWWGLRPIEKYEVWKDLGLPPVLYRLQLADVLSNLMLFFMIILAYACLSPAMCFLMCFIFRLLETGYRNQLIYVYSPDRDYGGHLWPHAVKILIICIIIAELTLFGVLGYQKGIIAAPLCLPLIVVTILFMEFLKQQHYLVPYRLPSINCSLEDKKNSDMSYDFLQNMYLQPSLKIKTLEPENSKT